MELFIWQLNNGQLLLSRSSLIMMRRSIHPEDSAKYRVYKIGLADTLNGGKDYLEWPSEYGAEVNENDLPVIFNHQRSGQVTIRWIQPLMTEKSGIITLHTPVMPIEIHQATYHLNGDYRVGLKMLYF
ncbi:MAG: hypothetical protein U5J96_00500 [Ignavibacteriaceae bacterium]|nr:hypothetical protein [Ignavibacteriaceae bacterium]